NLKTKRLFTLSFSLRSDMRLRSSVLPLLWILNWIKTSNNFPQSAGRLRRRKKKKRQVVRFIRDSQDNISPTLLAAAAITLNIGRSFFRQERRLSRLRNLLLSPKRKSSRPVRP